MAAASPTYGDYKCLSVVGRGSFAQVYLGEHKITKERVAIKVVDRDRMQAYNKNNNLDRYIQREIAIMKSLDHLHIVKLHDVMDNGHVLVLVMEYCDGGTLKEFVVNRPANNRKLPEDMVYYFLKQLALGLEFLFDKLIIHRDLKPQNLLLVSNSVDPGRPILKIADFGFARVVDRQLMNSYLGTPLYMAPEIKGGVYNFQCDLWSVGVIMYELLAGRQLVDTQLELNELHMGRRRPMQGDLGVSDECFHMLDRLLAVDVTKRLTWREFFTHPFLNPPPAPSLIASRPPAAAAVAASIIQSSAKLQLQSSIVPTQSISSYSASIVPADTNNNSVVPASVAEAPSIVAVESVRDGIPVFIMPGGASAGHIDLLQMANQGRTVSQVQGKLEALTRVKADSQLLLLISDGSVASVDKASTVAAAENTSSTPSVLLLTPDTALVPSSIPSSGAVLFVFDKRAVVDSAAAVTPVRAALITPDHPPMDLFVQLDKEHDEQIQQLGADGADRFKADFQLLHRKINILADFARGRASATFAFTTGCEIQYTALRALIKLFTARADQLEEVISQLEQQLGQVRSVTALAAASEDNLTRLARIQLPASLRTPSRQSLVDYVDRAALATFFSAGVLISCQEEAKVAELHQSASDLRNLAFALERVLSNHTSSTQASAQNILKQAEDVQFYCDHINKHYDKYGRDDASLDWSFENESLEEVRMGCAHEFAQSAALCEQIVAATSQLAADSAQVPFADLDRAIAQLPALSAVAPAVSEASKSVLALVEQAHRIRAVFDLEPAYQHYLMHARRRAIYHRNLSALATAAQRHAQKVHSAYVQDLTSFSQQHKNSFADELFGGLLDAGAVAQLSITPPPRSTWDDPSLLDQTSTVDEDFDFIFDEGDPAQLIRENARLRVELQSALDRVTALNQQTARGVGQLALVTQLTQELAQLRAVEHTYRAEATHSVDETRVQELTKALEAERSARLAEQEEHRSRIIEYGNIVREVRKQQEATQAESAARVCSLEAELQEAQQRLRKVAQDWEATRATVGSQDASLRTRVEQLTAALVAREKEIVTLKEERTRATQTTREVAAALSSRTRELAQASVETTGYAEQLGMHQKRLAEKEREAAHKADAIRELEQKVARIEAEKEQLALTIRDLDEQRRKLSSNTSLTGFIGNLLKTQEALRFAQQEKIQAETSTEQALGSLAKAERRVTELEQNLAEFESALDTLKLQNQHLTDELLAHKLQLTESRT